MIDVRNDMPSGVILASTSPYRRALLAKLGVAFTCLAPAIDESARVGETPRALALRLAQQKAAAVARCRPAAIVVGSDQVAELDGIRVGKPHVRAVAVAQVRAASAKTVVVHTAVCVLAANAAAQCAIDTTTVRFRTLGDAEIGRYVDIEQPFDCAGSFKAEGLGISLFEAIESTDPSALIGLPLIALATMLRSLGIAVP